MVAASEQHALYCFDVLAAHLLNLPTPAAPTAFQPQHCPLFVTWTSTRPHNGHHRNTSNSNNHRSHGNTQQQQHDRLCGCIGNFNPQPLDTGLAEYAITSATKDHRFDPITRHDISDLVCTVSLLTDFSLAEDYMDWELGVHGIWIDFYDHHERRRTATYLPEVAVEQGWGKVEAVDALLHKGGLRGGVTEETRQRVTLTRYRSSKCRVTYADWIAARKEVRLGGSELAKVMQKWQQWQETEVATEKVAEMRSSSMFSRWWMRN